MPTYVLGRDPLPKLIKRQTRRKSIYKQAVAQLDKLCANAVRERDGHRCTLCGSVGESGRVLDWAHIISRRYHSVRWAWNNSTTLCRTCHQRFTRRPDEWFDLCETKMGRDAYLGLRTRALCLAGKQPLDLWLLAVQAGPKGIKP